MPKTIEVTPKKRAVCVALSNEGLSCRDIAGRIGISKSSVSRALQLFKETGQYSGRKRSGRPRVTTRRDDLLIRRAAVRNPFISSREIVMDLPQLKVSPRSVRRRLAVEFNLRSRCPARKPLLTDGQRKKRVAFCKKYAHWSAENWRKVLFSDESTFCQFGTHTNRVRRPPNQRYDRRYTIATMKHPQKLMVWGCFSGAGRGSLYFVPTGDMVNAQKYLGILQSRLIQTMLIHNLTVFQHDGAPAHTAKCVQLWLREHNVEVLDWPGNSPDLNPIENLWELMKRRLAKRAPRNIQDVIYWLKKIWCQEISNSLCENLANSMPRRIREVLRSKGHQTRY